MPPLEGQFKTRRNPETGRLESIPEEERGALIAAATGITSPPPAAEDPFITRQRGAVEPPPLPGEPPALPDEPPPLPPAPPPLPGEEEETGIAGAAQGAAMGGKYGPLGAVAGGAVGFLMAQVTKPHPSPIGTLEGGGATTQGDNDLRELLDVTKGIARIGTPIKDAVLTESTDSRM